MKTQTLTVDAVHPHLGGAAATLQLRASGEATDWRWQPGQYLTLALDVGGEQLRRCYSLSAAPEDGLQITVKRVAGGRVSNHLLDAVRVGDPLAAAAPQGAFVCRPAPRARRSHYFFAAGSGITPIIAMIEALLRGEPQSQAFLLYGNRDHRSVLFHQRLTDLQAEYPERLLVRHALSDPSWLSGFSPWCRGRVDAASLADFFAENPPYAQDARYYLCGPGGFNATVSTALADLDVPAERLARESFGDAAQAGNDAAAADASVPARVQLQWRGQGSAFDTEAGETVLAAARRHGVELPSGCEAGACGACRATLLAGRGLMRQNLVLDEAEVAAGQVLCCQLQATSDALQLRIDE